MIAVLAGALLLAARGEVLSARFRSGNLPALPPLAAEGGLLVLELRITASGIVREAIVVDDSPPFTEALTKVVRLWEFEPASFDGEPRESRISVVGVFRAPTLLGGAPPAPRRTASPSPSIAYPTSTVTPAYPPQALESGVVMMEAEVDENGAVADVQILGVGEGFAAVAVEAARKFRFRPATSDGRPVRSHAILVFGFPQPITPPRRR